MIVSRLLPATDLLRSDGDRKPGGIPTEGLLQKESIKERERDQMACFRRGQGGHHVI